MPIACSLRYPIGENAVFLNDYIVNVCIDLADDLFQMRTDAAAAAVLKQHDRFRLRSLE